MNNLDKSIASEKAVISKEALIKNFGISDGRNLYWTDSKDVELPVLLREGDDIPLRTIP